MAAPRLDRTRKRGRGVAIVLSGLTIANVENGDALLSGEIVDQSALHGVLNKVRDLGLPLMAVSRIKPLPAGLRPIQQDDEKGVGKR